MDRPPNYQSAFLDWQHLSAISRIGDRLQWPHVIVPNRIVYSHWGSVVRIEDRDKTRGPLVFVSNLTRRADIADVSWHQWLTGAITGDSGGRIVTLPLEQVPVDVWAVLIIRETANGAYAQTRTLWPGPNKWKGRLVTTYFGGIARRIPTGCGMAESKASRPNSSWSSSCWPPLQPFHTSLKVSQPYGQCECG